MKFIRSRNVLDVVIICISHFNNAIAMSYGKPAGDPVEQPHRGEAVPAIDPDWTKAPNCQTLACQSDTESIPRSVRAPRSNKMNAPLSYVIPVWKQLMAASIPSATGAPPGTRKPAHGRSARGPSGSRETTTPRRSARKASKTAMVSRRIAVSRGSREVT